MTAVPLHTAGTGRATEAGVRQRLPDGQLGVSMCVPSELGLEGVGVRAQDSDLD